jgi:hypothetical protein
MGMLCCLYWRDFDSSAGTRRVHFGTRGHSRARATSRDVVWNVLEMTESRPSLDKLLQTGTLRCPRRRETDPSYAREGGHLALIGC